MEYQPAPTPSYAARPGEAASYASGPGPTTASIPPSSAPVPAYPPPQDPRLERPVAVNPFAGADIRSVKTACEFSLGEYLTLQRRLRYDDPASERRLRAQQGIVVSDLHALRTEVTDLVKNAEAHRWRKWLLGGVVAAFIPAVRRIFRRSSKDKEANDTEYAFKKSKGLISRILSSVHGKGKFASVAFFVLSILYVFESEVSLRVARTMSKRLKKLTAKVERGDQGIGEDDLKILNGWRWRVLLW